MAAEHGTEVGSTRGSSVCSTRSVRDMYVKKTRLVKSDERVLQAGVNLFNILPTTIKEKRCDKSFKHLLLGLLVGCCPYSVQEFRDMVKVGPISGS